MFFRDLIMSIYRRMQLLRYLALLTVQYLNPWGPLYLNPIVFMMRDLLVNDMTGNLTVNGSDEDAGVGVGIGFADDLMMESDASPNESTSTLNDSVNEQVLATSHQLLVEAGIDEVSNFHLSHL